MSLLPSPAFTHLESLNHLANLIRVRLAAASILNVDSWIARPGSLKNVVRPLDARFAVENFTDSQQSLEPFVSFISFKLFNCFINGHKYKSFRMKYGSFLSIRADQPEYFKHHRDNLCHGQMVLPIVPKSQ